MSGLLRTTRSGLGDHAEEYGKWVTEGDERFAGCKYTVFPVAGHQFPRLALRYKPNLVSLEGGTQVRAQKSFLHAPSQPLQEEQSRSTERCRLGR